ncbi:MAG: hypothetical protein ACREGR_00160 [Minisyncoccia bacterium]
MTESLTTYRVGRYGLEVSSYDQYDPRGLLLVWEPPSNYADYSMGVDPTVGVLGWSRSTRTDEDYKHDNAAIEVYRSGQFREEEIKQADGRLSRQMIKQPDRQVAEWVGPIDAQDLAYVVNFIGRMFGGSHEDQQALATIEVYPGPGWLTQREMKDKFGYSRFLPWLQEGKNMIQRDTGKRGWISNQHTRRDLWVRSGGHIKRRRAILRSKWLVEEMVACTPDNFIGLTARAARLGKSQLNDDRVVATMLALWAANEWQIGQEPSEPAGVETTDRPDWQLSSMTAEEMADAWDARMAELQE